jgi:hypothetical protein
MSVVVTEKVDPVDLLLPGEKDVVPVGKFLNCSWIRHNFHLQLTFQG